MGLLFLMSCEGSKEGHIIKETQKASQSGQDAVAFDTSQLAFNVEKYKLPNGLTVLLHVDRSFPMVYFHQWFDVGSRNEKAGQTGYAHFFEHLMFKGTKRFTGAEFQFLVKGAGGSNNAFTSYDYTGYYISYPSAYLETAIRLESDRMHNLFIRYLDTPEKEKQAQKFVNSEREVVKQERRQRTDNSVSGQMWEQTARTVFEGSQYGWPVIGSMEDLNQSTLEDFKTFYRTYYTPSNTTVVIGGDFKVSEAKQWIQKYYQDIPKGEKASFEFTSSKKGDKIQDLTVKKPSASPAFYFSFLSAPLNDPDVFALDLLGNILSSGLSSRLHKNLVHVKDAILADVGAVILSFKYSGTFIIEGTLHSSQVPKDSNKGVLEALGKIKKEIQTLINKGVSERELQKAKNIVLKGKVEDLKSLRKKVYGLAHAEVVRGDYKTMFSELGQYNQVTTEDIVRVAKKHILDQWSTGVLVKALPKQ